MNRCFNEIPRRVCSRANCSPSMILLPVLVILGVVVWFHRGAAATAAVDTIGVLALGSILFGGTLLVRTVISWRKTAEPVAEPPMPGQVTVTASGEVLEPIAVPVGSAPASDAERMAAEADALLDDKLQLRVTPDGEIVPED